MSPYKSATFDNELSSGGGGSDIGIDANNDLLGLRNLSTTQNITAGTLNTGQITGTGEIIAGEGSDLSFVFGNAKIGWTGSSSTFIGFSHKDQHGINTAALQQTATGTTALNAAAGENLWLSIQGVPKLAIAPNGKIGVNNLSPSKELDVVGEIKASGNITSDGTISAGVDTDKTHRLGYATIGNIGFNGNAAFGHSSRLADGIDGYALLATGTGTTYLHAKTGKDIGFRIGTTGLNSMTCLANGTVQVGNKTTAIAGAMLDVRGRIYADRISCSAGSDISCEFGMAVIGHAPPKVGTTETCDDSVIFAHKDFANCHDYAIKQTDTGETILNSKSGQSLFLAINNQVRMTVKAGHQGNIGIGTENPTEKLEVVGNIKATGDIHATGNITSSDDRLKHNEVGITNGLEVIRRLAPVVYDKTKDMILGVPFTGNFNGDLGDLGVPFKREAGFIAQDVKLIDDVEFAVKGGDYTNEQGQLITSSFGINYNDLFTYGLAATKEIDAIISPYPVRFDNIETDVETFSLIAMGNKTDIGRHEARIDNIESDIVANAATAAANLLTLETNTATNRATDNAAANLLNSRVGAVEATISAYPNRFATIEGELLRINSIDLDVGTLKTDMTAVENWMNAHMATTGGDGERITTLETEVAGLSNVTFAKANETDLIAALYRITTLEVDLAGAVDDLTAALSRITALESEVAA